MMTKVCNTWLYVANIEGGSLEQDQAAPGDVTWFNFWDYDMTLIQLNALTSSSEGNVASMNTLKIAGSVSQYMIDFPPKGVT